MSDWTEDLVLAGGPSVKLIPDGRTFVLSFIGPDLLGGSLPDGHYTLVIPATSVSNSLGSPLASDFTTSFQRLFGDSDGDGDADRADRKLFLQSYGATQFQPQYRSFFDHDASGAIDKDDRALFMRNFNASVKNASNS